MSEIKLPIQLNPLRTKDDLRLAFQQLSEPLSPYLSEGKARLLLGGSGASSSEAVGEMEGFCRVLWGMVPLLAGGGHSELWKPYLQGIINGTNPHHAEYWGEPGDYDQRLVEMAVFGMALSLIPEQIWEPLDSVQKQHLYDWLNAINSHPVYDCNWLLFHVLVNMGFKRVGLPYDKEGMEKSLDRIEAFDLGGGWYADGVGGHSDYYVPFALHYYGLVYAKLMESEDPHRSRLFKERAVLFAQDFISWFSVDGSALPYGRSLAYRFAQSAFWSALAYAEIEVYSPGVVKGIVLRNLRWWFEQPIFLPNGVLSIGYTYPNLVMAENYNSPGSPYWALKTFLILALPDDHAFWQAEELPLPALPESSAQLPAHLVLCREEESGHVVAFNTGHPSTNEHTHTSAKYEKFAYSTAFGFSVPRAEWGLAQGAFDSMLALSERDNLFRVRRRNEEYRIEDNVLFTRWKPWHDVEVRTWIVAGLPWHVRVHRIETERMLTAAEGGFALARGEDLSLHQEAFSVKAACFKGVSGILGFHGYAEAEAVYPHANTNLLYPRTVIPTLKAELGIGIHWLVSAVYGKPAGLEQANSSLSEDQWGHNSIPSVTIEQGEIRINMLTGSYSIDRLSH
ncbi:DUF2264 domain-containing protein [Cohnella sp.]|uniref:DUF2264 domain-containing protein n=1 Tax=Cohnella sp. TaxID=1883426 RepID=UPI0035670903